MPSRRAVGGCPASFAPKREDRTRAERTPVLSIVALLTSVLFASTAQADEHFYVMPDGQKHRLVKSATELGVVLRPGADVEAVRQRVQTELKGAVRDVAGKRDSRLKIVELRDDVQGRRGRIRRDPAVERVAEVFRFDGVGTPVFSTGTVVAKHREDVEPAGRRALWGEYGLTEVEAVRGLIRVHLLRPAREGDDEVLAAQRLAEDARTLWANPNFGRVLERRQVIADPFFDRQWHLRNTGQTGGTSGADIDAVGAWTISTGQGIRFSMFDDGCDVEHEDLAQNYIGVGQDVFALPGEEGRSDPSPKNPGDFHGTNVMGLAVAAANNVGVRGVAFDGEFTATRGLNDPVSDRDIAEAYIFALDQNVDVHINSWGFLQIFGDFPNPPLIVDAIDTAFQLGRDLDGPGGNPPLGMVVVFAAGNDGVQNRRGFELSTLDQVIGVGASDPNDKIATFSNFGPDIEFLTPGDFPITTVDNQDTSEGQGLNRGGAWVDPESGVRIGTDIDPLGNYTGRFSGTSAACPIAAGVAGLMLSVNRNLTATQVRVIMEHTADKVSPSEARYNGVTSRSVRYGFGRINARRAVEAARDAAAAGGRTWPDVPSRLTVIGSFLRWFPGPGTDEFLVVERTGGAFDFLPEDGRCFSREQAGCESEEIVLEELPSGVSVLSVVTCDGDCDPNEEQSISFEPPSAGRKFFAIYTRNRTGLYSFGAGIDSTGGTGPGSVGTAGGVGTGRPPAVTIMATPLSGVSPLTVQLNGNAVSEFAIDPTRTRWDCGNNVIRPGTKAECVYSVPGTETQTFTARLSMADVTGAIGSAEVQIRVTGADTDSSEPPAGANTVRIIISRVDAPGTDISQGTAPLSVLMGVSTENLTGTVQSVRWDLGDGTQANSLMVPHIYENTSTQPFTFVVVARVTINTPTGGTITRTAQRLITVLPGTAPQGPTEDFRLPGTTPTGSGGPAAPCGALGLIPPLFLTGTLLWIRRRRE